MTRVVACLALACGVAHAQPVPRVPAYVHPATVADAKGATSETVPVSRDGGVWYPADAHYRLTVMLAAVEPLSTARATRAWAWGYEDGRLVNAAECDTERARRVAAEAEAEAKASSWAPYIAAGAVGVVVGLVGGVVLGGLL